MLTAVKQAVRKMSSKWWLFVEWPLCQQKSDGGQLNLTVDCMLVADGVPLRMLAVEFNGTSHDARPFAFIHQSAADSETKLQADFIAAHDSPAGSARAQRKRKRTRSKETWKALQDQESSDRSKAEFLKQLGTGLVELSMHKDQVEVQHLVRKLTALAAAPAGDENVDCSNAQQATY
jgi:hypothetical protein